MPITRPTSVEETHLVYLDELRESAVTNMFQAAPYLIGEFDLSEPQAHEILSYWMDSFDERNSD